MPDKQVIFVERASDAAAAFRLAEAHGNSAIIALNSSVMWALDKQGVEYHIGLDYYDMDELLTLKEDLYPRTEEICGVINNALQDCDCALRERQLEWANSIFHPIKCMLNTVNQQLLHVARVIRAERPDQITIFAPEPERPLPMLNLDPANINLWNKLVIAIARSNNIAVHIEPEPTGLSACYGKFSRSLGTKLQRIRTLCRKLPSRIKRRTHAAGFANDSSAHWSMPKVESPMRVLFLKPRYSHGLLAKHMKARGIGEAIMFDAATNTNRDTVNISDDIQAAWKRLRTDERLADLMTFEGLDITPIVERYLRRLLAKGLSTALAAYDKTRDILSSKTVDAAVMTTVTYPDDWAVALACRQAGIPVVTWQHGSYAMFDPHTQPTYYDIRHADSFFAFGEGARRAFEKHAAKWKCEIVPVGSAVLDRLRADPITPRHAGTSRKTVLVPLRGLNITVLGDSYLTYPLDVYWRELTKMLEAISKFNELRFILKLYPTNTPLDNPIADFLKSRRITNVKIEYVRGFMQVLPKTDMVLLDWPYSTLLEAACTDLPIVCYKRHWPLRDGVEEMIAKRCFLADNPDELEEILDKYRSGQLPALTDRTLLRQYGNHADDGGSVCRGIQELDKIISRSHKHPK